MALYVCSPSGGEEDVEEGEGMEGGREDGLGKVVQGVGEDEGEEEWGEEVGAGGGTDL